MDVKKLGSIPDGDGHWTRGREASEANARARNLGEGLPKVGISYAVIRSSTMPWMTIPARLHGAPSG